MGTFRSYLGNVLLTDRELLYIERLLTPEPEVGIGIYIGFIDMRMRMME